MSDSVTAREVAVVTHLGGAPSGRVMHVVLEGLARIRWLNGATLLVGFWLNFPDVAWVRKLDRRQLLPLDVADPAGVNPWLPRNTFDVGDFANAWLRIAETVRNITPPSKLPRLRIPVAGTSICRPGSALLIIAVQLLDMVTSGRIDVSVRPSVLASI